MKLKITLGKGAFIYTEVIQECPAHISPFPLCPLIPPLLHHQYPPPSEKKNQVGHL